MLLRIAGRRFSDTFWEQMRAIWFWNHGLAGVVVLFWHRFRVRRLYRRSGAFLFLRRRRHTYGGAYH